MTRAVNDATLQKAGDIYQYLINNIKKLSMNPHFYSLLMQSFLSGYEKPCEIKLPFMAIPIIP